MRRRIAPAFVTAAAALLLVFAPSCKPAAGKSCKPGQSACTSKSEALICQAGVFVSAACARDSCKVASDILVCDQSQAEIGATCIADLEYACSADKSTGLQCVGGVFQKTVACRGPRGCRIEAKRIACDTSTAQEGDACTTEDILSCTADKTTLLRCKLKVFESYRVCRGPRGCVPDDTLPQCDNSLARAGDPCPQPGRVACSVDKQRELICRGGRYELSRECKKSCTPSVVGSSIDCR